MAMTKRSWLSAAALFGGFLPVMALFGAFPDLQMDIVYSAGVHGNALFLSAFLPGVFVLLNTGRPLVRPRSYVVDGLVLGYSISIFIRLIVSTFAHGELTIAFADWSSAFSPAAAHLWRIANAVCIMGLMIYSAVRIVHRQVAAQASRG